MIGWPCFLCTISIAAKEGVSVLEHQSFTVGFQNTNDPEGLRPHAEFISPEVHPGVIKET
jgi:hypothetical protein